MSRLLTAHEVLRLAPTLPGSEVRVFYEPDSRAVQVLFVGAMTAHDLDPSELGIVFRLAPALDGRYEPARLVGPPEFRWQDAAARAFGDDLGDQVRAWAVAAYDEHLSDQEYRLRIWLQRPGATNTDDTLRTLEKLRQMRLEFRARVGPV